MSKVVFADALGSPLRKVSPDEMTNLLSSRSEEYWNNQAGSGSAQLFFCEDEGATSIPTEIALNFTSKDGVGFYIDHHGGGSDWHNAFVGGMDLSEIVRIPDPQEGFRLFPRCLFVPLTDASEVISYFFQAGGRSPKVKWLPINSIPWPELEKETERIRIEERNRNRRKK